MRVVTNEKFIARNAKIGRYAGIAAIVVLGAGVYLTFAHPEMVGPTFVLLIVGFVLSQVGIYFTNRWARPPRLDLQLTKALKGLGRDYTLYHYSTPASHLLVGPGGVFVIVMRFQRGRITYSKGKWRQHGGLMLWYWRIFAQEGIGRPDLEIKAEVEAVEQLLKENLPEEDYEALKPVQAILVFTDPRAEIDDVSEAPVPTVKIEDLKDTIKKLAKGKRLTGEQLKRIRRALGDDPKHKNKAESSAKDEKASKKDKDAKDKDKK
ncbi:MAG: NERD domain-containing protein [Chloroflexi bacterium]|nr:NERD domain-containing protein [Chloroflexota bacterium]